jgi:hypothetical protein
MCDMSHIHIYNALTVNQDKYNWIVIFELEVKLNEIVDCGLNCKVVSETWIKLIGLNEIHGLFKEVLSN